ncbi:MAG: hypothetical protein RBT34_11155 [Anaerolineaceae bacterium]|jgi:hypothetical protein|nr:hypothetical protein [Anaerolineaceae bacterium]
MPTKRTTYFLLAIFAGLVIGLAFGWFVKPAAVRRVAPQHLRQDYQTDYVLMVAETYASEGNAASAVERLHFLGDEPVNVYVRQAMLTAGQTGYSQQDVETMNALSMALQSWIPQPDEDIP